jgi:hypothetical protein
MDIEEATNCGLYCGLCASRRRIPRQAATLRETLRKEGYDQGYCDVPGLAEILENFWSGLNRLADCPCCGCRAGGGNPGCAIRACARERSVVACPLCPEYPCKRLEMLRHYPMLFADGKRMQHLGLERWIAEQEERAATGFAYSDFRFPEADTNG